MDGMSRISMLLARLDSQSHMFNRTETVKVNRVCDQILMDMFYRFSLYALSTFLTIATLQIDRSNKLFTKASMPTAQN